MKAIFGMFSQETNSFSPLAGNLGSFASMPNTPRVRVIADMISEEGIETVPSVFLRADSSGAVTKEVLDLAVNGIVKAIKESSPEGIFLYMHGATQCETEDDAVGYILEKAREAAGKDTVIGASFDFHANVTEKIMKNADIICGFRTYPHTDNLETAQRMTRLGLDKLLGRRTPYMHMIKLPMIHQAEACLTVEGPMQALMQKAEPELYEGVYDISVFQVQPWLNAPEAGAAVIVIADSKEHAEDAADKLAREYWAIRKDLKYDLYDLDKVIDMALAKPGKPVIISDSADSPPAGSPGDSPAILKRLLERGLENELVSYMTLNDPAATEKAFEAGVGETVEITLGGAYEKKLVKPITVKAYVKLLHDGTIKVYNDNLGTFNIIKMGRTAVLSIGNISVVVADFQINSVYDDMYKNFGLNPKKADVIVAKSAIGYRAYYRKYTDLMFTVDTPGSSSSNLFQFDYNKITRPCYPFDDIEDYNPISSIGGYTDNIK